MPSETVRPGQIIEAPVPSSGAAAARSGSIVLARHAEPALSRRIGLSSREYRDWWALYEAGGILAGQVPPEHLRQAANRAGVIYTSTRLRSIESAKTLAEGRDLLHDAVFIEAPLPPPPLPDWIKLSPRKWGVISRVWWWFTGRHGEETRKQAEARAANAARMLDDLARGGEDVLLVAHGFFNTMIGLELRRIGWRCVKGRGYKYWSTRYFRRR